MFQTGLARHAFLKNRFFYFFRPKPIALSSRHARWRKVAKALQLSPQARLRLEWIIFYETAGTRNATETARHFGIARKTFNAWRGRFREDNLRTLEDRPKTPKRKRQRLITPSQESRVVALRKQYIRYSPPKLAVLYRREYGEKLSAWQIQKTIEKYHLYANPAKNRRTQAKRRRAHLKKRITEFLTKPFPGHLVQLDTIVIYWNGVKRYILTAIDRHSRVAFARMYTSASSRNAADFLARIWYVWGGRIENALSDNGSEFLKYFERACLALGITHWFSRVKTPKDNAHNERFNRTIQEEFVNLGNFTPDVATFNRNLTEWLIEYNYTRPHFALKLQTPMEFLQRYGQCQPEGQSCVAQALSTLTPMYSYPTRH